MPDDARPPYELGSNELAQQLRIQVGFIARSSAAYDDGYEDEARRLATVIRVLVHDTRRSTSLLKQLGLKEKLRYYDTSAHPPPGAIAFGVSGLAMQRLTTGPGGGGRYVPVGDDPSPERIRPPVPFPEWWSRPFQIGSDDFTRKQVVLNVANQDGGAHVDPTLDALYAKLTRTNFPAGLTQMRRAWNATSKAMLPLLACVRSHTSCDALLRSRSRTSWMQEARSIGLCRQR